MISRKFSELVKSDAAFRIYLQLRQYQKKYKDRPPPPPSFKKNPPLFDIILEKPKKDEKLKEREKGRRTNKD
jgi:hypothetical protein